jgi:hypothetical protein
MTAAARRRRNGRRQTAAAFNLTHELFVHVVSCSPEAHRLLARAGKVDREALAESAWLTFVGEMREAAGG